MADTKIGWNQVNSPAPLWYRRLSNAITLSFLPGYVAVVQSISMSHDIRNILMLVGTSIPFIMNGIGQLLGNGQSYSPPNEVIDKLSQNK